MPLDAAGRTAIARFREQFEKKYTTDARFGQPERLDRDDESTLISRFPVADKMWIELCVRPFVPQVRAGIVTDDRWKNEDLEDAIESTGDNMHEFMELGFEEAGLSWKDPPVEHYRDQGKYFYFATPVELSSLAAIGESAIFERACRVFEGYFEAFATTIRKARAAATE